MKALLLEAKNTLKIRTVAEPKVGDNEVLVSVEVASIGGSEYLGLTNSGVRPLPNAMGHGITGTISMVQELRFIHCRGVGPVSTAEVV